MITSGTRSTTTGLPTTKQQAREASAGKYGGGKGWRRQEEAGGKKVLDGNSHVRAGSVNGEFAKISHNYPVGDDRVQALEEGLLPERHYMPSSP